jgi:hypothetical protein
MSDDFQPDLPEDPTPEPAPTGPRVLNKKERALELDGIVARVRSGEFGYGSRLKENLALLGVDYDLVQERMKE